jgi:hypothetical protein
MDCNPIPNAKPRAYTIFRDRGGAEGAANGAKIGVGKGPRQAITAVKRLWKLVPALLAAALCLSSPSFADAQKPVARKHTKKKQTEPPLPPYTPSTLSQLPLDQVPAVPPEVTYHAGQLSIIAHNSTLADVLRAVRKETGAELDIPSGANDRVVTDLGPGPARDVLAKLLNGSHFNYVMLGSPTDPTMIQRIVLTSKTGPETASAIAPPQPAAPTPNPVTNRFGPMPQAQMPNGAPQMQTGEEADQQADENVDTSDDANAEQGDENQDQQAEQPSPPPPPKGPDQVVKSPEQLLQELQRQQQLQQQQPNQGGQPQMVYPNGLPTPNGNEPGSSPEQ